MTPATATSGTLAPAPQRRRRRLIRRAVVGAAILVPVLLASLVVLDNTAEPVRWLLEGAPRARNVDVREYDEGVLGASLLVDGDAAKPVSFNTPGAVGLWTGRRIYLEEIGPYGFFTVRDAHDLVSRYDEVVAAIAEMPQTGVYHGPDGRTYAYRISTEPFWGAPVYEQLARDARAAAKSPASPHR